jgi:hypothetical protein
LNRIELIQNGQEVEPETVEQEEIFKDEECINWYQEFHNAVL